MSESRKQAKKVSIWKALRFSPSVIMDIVFGTILLNILALALPLTLMQVYDRIIAQRASGTLLILSSGCVIAILLETIVHIARDRISSWCGSRFEFKELNRGFETLLLCPISQLEGERTIEKLEELNSFTALKTSYFLRAIQNVIDVPFSLLNLLFVYILVPRIAYFLIVLILFTLLVHGCLFFLVFVSKTRAHSAHHDRDKNVIETFRFLNMIRAFSLEEPILRRVEKAQETLARSSLQASNLSTFSSSYLLVLPQLAIFGVLLTGASSVLKHSITVGVLTTCMMLAGRCIAPIIALVSTWLNFEERHSQEKKANALLSLQQDHWEKTKQTAPLRGEIDLVELSFSYPEDTSPLVQKISLKIAANSMVCIKSSYDKSSSAFAELLLRNIEAEEGDIFFDGMKIEEIPVGDFYRDVHGLSAHPVFFRGTILENLASFDVTKFDDALRISTELHLDNAIAGFDLGFSSMMDRENLLASSSSLLLRMAITRALIKGPRILIINGMDSCMDVETKQFFINVLTQLKGKCTILCITRDVTTLALSDQIMTLKDGVLVEG